MVFNECIPHLGEKTWQLVIVGVCAKNPASTIIKRNRNKKALHL